MSLRERLDFCKGLDAPAIASALADVDQDDVTAEIMRVFGERTLSSALPRVPFTMQHTMYGDLDVSDWLLRYAGTGFEVVPAPPDAVADAMIRWEHWEDAVRMLNGDAGEVALFFTRRIATVGDAAADGLARRWMGCVDFTGSGDPEGRPGVLMDRLRSAAAAGDKHLAAFIEDKGLPVLLRARAMNMASSVIDIGAGADLAGSYMRLVIDAQPPVGVETVFDAAGNAAETRLLANQELGGEDPSQGVTLQFESVQAFVDAVTFRQEMPQQITSGQLRVMGAGDRVSAFGLAMMKLANALRPAVS